MSSSKNFLDGLGVEQLIEYTKTQLNTKLSAADADNLYALKEDLNSLLTPESLNDYATKEYVDEQVYDDSALQSKILKIESRITKTFSFKGNVNTFSILNQINERAVGDVYHIEDSNENYSWSGFEWVSVGPMFYLTLDHYLTQDEIDSTYVKNSELNNYLTQTEIEDNYVKNTTLNNYLTQTEIANTYATNNTLNNYLTKTEATNTYVTNNTLNDYLTKVEAENIYVKPSILEDYLTQSDAEGIYAKSSALENYLTKTEAENIYIKPSLLENYLTQSDAENIFVQPAELENYLTQSDAENIYTKNDELNNLIRATIYSVLSTGPVSTCASNQELQDALNSNAQELTVILNEDTVLSDINISNKKAILDLGGTNNTTNGMIIANNNSDITLTNGTLINTSNVKDHNRVLLVGSGSKATLNNITAQSENNVCLAVREGELVINNSNITAQESGVLGTKDSIITFNSGEIECIDNCPLQGNGYGLNNPGFEGTNAIFNMNGGILKAHITSSGYQACGVYIPNSGEFNMTGGQIISDGAGIVMRAGKVNLLGGEIICNIKTASGLTNGKGKVGDSRVVVPAVPIVYDSLANYPGLEYQDFELIIDMNNMIFRMGDGSGSLDNLITLTDPEEIVTQLLGTNDEVIVTNENGIYHIFMEQK